MSACGTHAGRKPVSEPAHTPDALVGKVRESRVELEASLRDITNEEMLRPGMTGRWSGKDTLAHIARWDDATADLLLGYLRDGVNRGSDYDDYEAWNARWEVEDRDITLAEARSRFAGAHATLTGTLERIPADRWDDVVLHWVRLTGIQHYGDHLAPILAWRRDHAKANAPPR